MYYVIIKNYAFDRRTIKHNNNNTQTIISPHSPLLRPSPYFPLSFILFHFIPIMSFPFICVLNGKPPSKKGMFGDSFTVITLSIIQSFQSEWKLSTCKGLLFTKTNSPIRTPTHPLPSEPHRAIKNIWMIFLRAGLNTSEIACTWEIYIFSVE